MFINLSNSQVIRRWRLWRFGKLWGQKRITAHYILPPVLKCGVGKIQSASLRNIDQSQHGTHTHEQNQTTHSLGTITLSNRVNSIEANNLPS